jgi:hypothetical protein
VRVVVSRHERKLLVRDGSMIASVGEHIDNVQLDLEACPRAGELLTVHPTGEPSDESWTVQITGVQHVAGVTADDPSALVPRERWTSVAIVTAVAT